MRAWRPLARLKAGLQDGMGNCGRPGMLQEMKDGAAAVVVNELREGRFLWG